MEVSDQLHTPGRFIPGQIAPWYPLDRRLGGRLAQPVAIPTEQFGFHKKFFSCFMYTKFQTLLFRFSDGMQFSLYSLVHRNCVLKAVCVTVQAPGNERQECARDSHAISVQGCRVWHN
jgi:hypothetical protein